MFIESLLMVIIDLSKLMMVFDHSEDLSSSNRRMSFTLVSTIQEISLYIIQLSLTEDCMAVHFKTRKTYSVNQIFGRWKNNTGQDGNNQSPVTSKI